ncbi:hypothetical protein FOZ60_010140 [Perkinsus olseni]|uniref:Uncharacterized protein n=1 Tax=Perkinsus olseni TaxID=32597 RepID=A0A7J6PCM4_PEROL|nr:hypothetical protein FOZ60_010140 [Perkinsus olseni]
MDTPKDWAAKLGLSTLGSVVALRQVRNAAMRRPTIQKRISFRLEYYSTRSHTTMKHYHSIMHCRRS